MGEIFLGCRVAQNAPRNDDRWGVAPQSQSYGVLTSPSCFLGLRRIIMLSPPKACGDDKAGEICGDDRAGGVRFRCGSRPMGAGL
jgi:hypothetical protein